jgi:DNA-binding transcriptional regulator LsrR (DeoR family)
VNDEASLATRAAWLHFAGGLTQGEVATRLKLQSTKAHRLIARASREGMIRVFIDGPVAECIALEERLCECYKLPFCQVAPDLDDEIIPFKALGNTGARFLRAALERGEDRIIGVGYGRTLAACMEHLPRTPAPHTRFVSLLGGLTRKFAASPFDVIHRLAERTGADAYVMPVPFFVNSAEDKAVMAAQRGVREVLALARQASLLFVGIGTVDPDASLVSSGMIEPAELDELKRSGAAGEILGTFFDAAGRPVETGLTARTLALDAGEMSRRNTVAIAGGRQKGPAIKAILNSGYLSGLITDERTATELVGKSPERSGNKKKKRASSAT